MRDSKVNCGEQLLKVIDTKENIYKLRNEIVDRLNEKIPMRKFVNNTQGSQVYVPIYTWDIFRDLLPQNEQDTIPD